MHKLLFSFGKDIDVEELTLVGMDVNYEKALHSSNLHDLLSQLSTDLEKKKAAAGEQVHLENVGKSDVASTKHDCADPAALMAGAVSTVSGAVSQAAGTVRRAVGAQEAGKRDRELTLHKVLVRSIGAKVVTHQGNETGPRHEVEDIRHDDFATESRGSRAVVDVIHVLLITVIKSVLATVRGKHTKKVKEAVDGVERRLKKGFSEAREAAKGREQEHPRWAFRRTRLEETCV